MWIEIADRASDALRGMVSWAWESAATHWPSVGIAIYDSAYWGQGLGYEALGLCPEGGAEQFIRDGDNTYGGRVVTNPSGGLLSKGHPLGATGLAQIAEIVWQLRGDAGDRQVANARVGLQHNVGIGGACVVSVLAR